MAEITVAALVVVLIVLFRVLRRLVLLERDFRDPPRCSVRRSSRSTARC